MAELVGMLFIIGFGLTALGYLIAWPLDSTQGFHAIMSVFLMPLWLLSGAFFPAGESGWLSWVIRANPLTYGVAGLRRLLYAGYDLPVAAGFPALELCVAVTVAFALACIAISVWLAGRRTSRDTR
jgi:ABC-type polysaccharide/polyol phosphate export permease